MLGLAIFIYILKFCEDITEKNDSNNRKKIYLKLIYAIKKNITTSIFSEVLVQLLRNSIKYVVLRAASDGLKIAPLRAMTIQSTFPDESFK